MTSTKRIGIIAIVGAALSSSVAYASEASMGGGCSVEGSGGSAVLAGALLVAAALTGVMRRQIRH